MNLAGYRRRYPNIDWSKPSPAAEFAMDPEDVGCVFTEIVCDCGGFPHGKHCTAVVAGYTEYLLPEPSQGSARGRKAQ